MKKVIYIFSVCVAFTLAVVCVNANGKALQRQQIKLNPENYTLICIDSSFVADSEMEAIIKPYRDTIDLKMNERLCICDEDMVASRPESNMTRFLTDLFLEKTAEFAAEKGVSKPDFALLNTSGIRSSFRKGELTVSDVFQVSPFENSAVVLSIDSAVAMELFKHVGERHGEALSGASLDMDKQGNISNVRIGGQPLRGDRIYKLATLDYIATGGDGFDCLAKIPFEVGCDVPVREFIINYLRRLDKSGKHAVAPTDERIHLISEK